MRQGERERKTDEKRVRVVHCGISISISIYPYLTTIWWVDYTSATFIAAYASFSDFHRERGTAFSCSSVSCMALMIASMNEMNVKQGLKLKYRLHSQTNIDDEVVNLKLEKCVPISAES